MMEGTVRYVPASIISFIDGWDGCDRWSFASESEPPSLAAIAIGKGSSKLVKIDGNPHCMRMLERSYTRCTMYDVHVRNRIYSTVDHHEFSTQHSTVYHFVQT